MSNTFSAQDVKILDSIIESRRTVRSFKAEVPQDSMITAIVHTGIYAPYAAIAIGDNIDFRRFFVFRKGSQNLALMNQMVKEAAKTSLNHIEKETQSRPDLTEKLAKYIQMLSSVSQMGLPGILEIPCIIVVAERRGIPSVENQSLAHVMQNMWLKATSLGLGFQLLTVVENLTENQEFSKLLKLPYGEFAFNGCIIGYAAQEPAPRKTMSADRVITWL